MKKILLIVLSLMLVVLPLAACGGNNNSQTNTNTTTNTETNTNTNTVTGTNTNTNTVTGTTTKTDTKTETNTSTSTQGKPVVSPESSYVSPTVEGILKNDLEVFGYADSFGVGGTMSDYNTETTLDVSKVASNAKYVINNGGTYRLTGTSHDGQIFVKTSKSSVVLVLDNLSLTSKSFAAPPIYIEGCSDVTIVLVGENYLSDNTTNDGEGAVIRVRSSNVTFDGRGTLNIDAKAKHGISNTKEMTINGGTYNITAPNQGIYGKLGLTINGGRFNINVGKSGLKSGDTDDGTIGYMNINSGSFNINGASNGLNCNGPVKVNDCRMIVDAEGGNAIEASKNIDILGGTFIFESYKSAISTDGNITIEGNTNIKIKTTGNGISGYDVDISTNGVIFVETQPTYELVNADTSPTEKTYVYLNGKYVLFDPSVHAVDSVLYVCRNSRGLAADNFMMIRSGVIGLDTYQDSINTDNLVIIGGRLVLNTTNDAIDASLSATIQNGAKITVLGSDKGIKAGELLILGGEISVIAETDAIKSEDATINGGTIYLFDKIDAGMGTATVNGGLILMISTTNDRQTTAGVASFFSKIIVNKDKAVGGKWLRITGMDDILVELPKNYTEKMAVYYTSPNMGSITVSIGTYSEQNGFIAEVTE